MFLALRLNLDRRSAKRKARGSDLKAKSQKLPSHQLSSHHIQCQRGCEPANALAIAGEVPLDHFRPAIASQSVEHQSHGFLRSSSRGSGYTRDADPERCLATITD